MNKWEELIEMMKLNQALIKKENKKNTILWILAIIGAVAAIAAIVYAVYRHFTPDYLEDFDDDFDEDFDDEFFEDEEDVVFVPKQTPEEKCAEVCEAEAVVTDICEE